VTDAVRIRRARPDDDEDLTCNAHASKRYWGYPDEWIHAWRRDLTFTGPYITNNTVRVAVDSRGDPVGCYALVGRDAVVQLDHLWVMPDWIGRGVGGRLFDHATQSARGLGAQSLEIESDPDAEGFYLRMGAERIGMVQADVCGVHRELPRLRFDLR
jgi:GNAT superfamily N-acetyltransferase